MERIAHFEKVSFEQFQQDWLKVFDNTEEEVRKIYEGIALPKRGTKHSAGYDFFLPVPLKLEAGKELLVPTGIRAKMEDDYVLMIFPRSSLGFKFRLQLDNTVAIIDSDYYYADNEGHIQCKVINDSREDKLVDLEAGNAFMQGIFVQYGICDDDDVTEERHGGFGSTSK